MLCCGDREKGPTKESQKWDYITLADFKATSAWNTAAYVWLWILFISTIVIYAVDTFTAVNLLVFNKWSSQVKPYIPFEYSKWIFAGCIIFSWALWGFEWFRAVRVIQRAGVAESYMDPLAVSLQSMRKQGFKRFLVFAELTKSKKGMDLVAFFTYFAFKGSIRIILAEGPRQVINTLTLIAVIKADFVDKSVSKASGITLFWDNLQQMYNDDKIQAIIIFSMMYSLLIWTISIICLASAAIMYIVFLWHYIPTQDGGLSNFCRRKIDKRLERIVESKVKAGIEEEERKRKKAEAKDWKAAQKAEKKGRTMDGAPAAPGFARQPTLPQLDSMDKQDDDLGLRRTDTAGSTTTLPPYASRPGTRNENRPPMPNYNNERPPPFQRSATMGSQYTTASYESDAPLLNNAAGPGESMPGRPTNFHRQDSTASFGRPQFPQDRSYSPGPDGTNRAFSPMSRTDLSQGLVASPLDARPESPYGRPMERSYTGVGPPRAGTGTPFDRQPFTGSRTPYDRPSTAGPRSATTAPFDARSGSVPPRAETTAPFDGTRSGSIAPLDRPPTSMSRAGIAYSPMSRADNSTPFDGGRSASVASYDRPPMSTSRAGSTVPFDKPILRQGTAASIGSNASFSRPIQQKPSQSFNRPFTPATTSTTDSYEMKSNPYISKAAVCESPSTYVAFNPNRTASPAPPRANTATPDYFNHKALPTPAPSRSLTAPVVEDNRASIGYSDIVDDYGDSHISGAATHDPGSVQGQTTWKPHY